MHTRRLVSFLLGAWMLGTGFMTYVAIQNLRSVDRFMELPAQKAKPMIVALGQDNTRLLLRHQASVMNRDYFRRWEQAELILGALVTVFLAFATQRRWLPLAMGGMALMLVAFLHLFISPEINFLADAVDFLAPSAASGQRTRLWALHQVYTAGTLVKLLLCSILTAYLLLFRPKRVSRRRVMSELDASDDAHFTHVTR